MNQLSYTNDSAKYRKRRLSWSPRYLFGGILTLFFLFVIVVLFAGDDDVHSSATRHQPLVAVHSNFLPTSEFRALQMRLAEHPLITRNALDPDNFKHTSGWLLQFNADNVQRFREMEEMKEVLFFFDRVRDSRSNAFVLNLLIAEEAPDTEEAVGAHRDDTVGIEHEDEFLAHQVNVLYVRVPDAMEGGELEAWPSEHEYSELQKAVVHAAQNVMVEFRGDALHRVRRFSSASHGKRTSLVMEQYRIPSQYYKYTRGFCVNRGCTT